MANATANSLTIRPSTKRTVTTVEHFDWDDEAQEWKPTQKSVTTEDVPAPEPSYPPMSPWVREPYRPYFPAYPVTNPPGLPQIYCATT